MARSNLFVALILIALASLAVPVGGQQAETTPTTGQTSKSTLRIIYEQDQENRSIADRARCREQVRQLISEGRVHSGEDYYYAAFVFQHGQEPSDYLYAHILAVTAVDKGLRNAIWLSTATLDRYLHSVRQPQVFGTQFGYGDRDDQEPYDRKLVSDPLRVQWCVATESTQAQILSDTRAGKGFRSTRTCPLPGARFDTK
jgi:hypothetical protein